MSVERADAVILGAGVMGASVAFHLATRGLLNVVLLERAARTGLGSTGRATGGQRALFGSAIAIRLSLLIDVSNPLLPSVVDWEVTSGSVKDVLIHEGRLFTSVDDAGAVREHTWVADEMRARRGDECGERREELQRRHHEMSHARGVGPGPGELIDDLAGLAEMEAILGQRRAEAVAAEPLEPLAIIGGDGLAGVKREALSPATDSAAWCSGG